MNKLFRLVVATACMLAAQNSSHSKNTYHSAGGAAAQARMVSPQVNPDRTIIFRLSAPHASQVALSFSGPKPMTKDAAGIWTATVGPVEPEIYQYNFVVDGLRILD